MPLQFLHLLIAEPQHRSPRKADGRRRIGLHRHARGRNWFLLKQVILGLAETVPAPERGAFAEAVKSALKDRHKSGNSRRSPVKDLVSEIGALKKNIASRIEAVAAAMDINWQPSSHYRSWYERNYWNFQCA